MVARRILWKKTKAGMLSLGLTISIIIAFIGASMITLAYYYRIQNYHLDRQLRLERNVISAANYTLANFGNIEREREYVFDLFGKSTDSVSVWMESWGVLSLASVKAFSKDDEKLLCFLVGVKMVPQEKHALYLVDENRSLFVAGNAVIEGACYLPKAGVKRAYIPGKTFTSPQLISGEQFTSAATFPDVTPKFQDALSQLIKPDTIFSDSLAGLLHQRELMQSFHRTDALHINSKDAVDITYKVHGRVMIRSQKQIVVHADAQIEDVVLIAPKLIIERGFKGRLQAFAFDTLVVEDEVSLDYPSVVGLLGNPNSYLELGRHSSVHGAVFSHRGIPEASGMVKVNAGAKITGQVFVNGPLYHLGEVNGGVTCRRFFLKLPSGIFENHLVDASITNRIMTDDDNFLAIPFAGQSDHTGVIKWMQ